MHRFKADEAYLVGEGKGPVGAYLDIEGIVALAKEKGVDVIHPGYGFLSENAEFARACAEAGITFVGPRAELLDMMGDKTAARALAQKINVPTLPGTEEPMTDRDEALKVAKEIGFPLIIKAAFGGGGRGMRVVHKAGDLADLLDEAQGEAGRAFGNPAVFLEKYIPRAKHIEVQILGDQHGNVIHLHERDCSGAAPAPEGHRDRAERRAAGKRVPGTCATPPCAWRRRSATTTPARSSFSTISTRNEWFFIEMNPRIQVEHTVTEVITGIDLVRAQILIAQGHALHGPAVGMPQQAKIPRNGYAVQCRITTEDPENKFTPDYGKILTYRSAGGFGMRLDGGMGYAGAVITPFYDSLLVKITASGQTFQIALQRMDRALREFRIRGVKTNIPFLENVIHNETFRTGQATTTLIDTTPELFKFKPRRDRATKLLNFLGDVIVNGNPQAKGYKPKNAARRRARRRLTTTNKCRPPGHAAVAAGTRPEKIRRMDAEAKAAARHRHDVSRRAPIAAGHARAQLRHAGRRRRRGAAHAASCSSAWRCGAARRSTPRCVFCTKIRGSALRQLRAKDSRTSVSRCSSAARTRSATPIIPTTSSPVS